MNQNFNKLPRRLVSKGKNKGKIKDLSYKLVISPDSYYVNGCYEYYNSKFQFSDFYNKDIQPHSWISKPRFLLDSKHGEFYKNDKQGCELAYYHLVSMYQDLDTCLQRLYDGYHDSMFIRFAQLSGIFTTEEHWEMLLRNWYMGFSMAMRRYYNACHNNYDPTTNLNYTTYFDTHFSNYLFYAIGRADQDNSLPTKASGEVCLKNAPLVRLNQLPEDLITIDIEGHLDSSAPI